MNNYVLRQIAMLSKWTFYGLIAQLICTGILLAGDGQAQSVKSVREHFIKIEFKDNSIIEAFNKIEQKTGYNFAYEKSNISKRVKLNKSYNGEIAVSEVLLDISEVANLKFKQVNKSIIVSEIVDKSSIEKNLEIIIQGITITGKVTSAEDSEGLPGVNVIVKGTAQGTVTDVEGNYNLEVPGEEVMLVFSSVGFLLEEVAVGTKTIIDLVLIPDITALEEIVVVGYGVQKKSDLTGAISSISKEEIAEFPIARVDQALQGRSSGVYVLNADGSPGGHTMIRIRGLNSINGGNEPLIVIDGLQGGSLDNLNPRDIESMEILKDASATAIYGSRGANGVVIVTTKLGRKGKPVIDAGYNIGWQKLDNKLPTMTAGQYARHVNSFEMTRTSQGNIPVPPFTDEEIAAYDRNGGTDWQEEVYQTGVVQNFQLSVSGATDDLKYMISTNYLDHTGILKASLYDRFSLRSNLQADISKAVQFGINWSFISENRESPSFRRGEEVSFGAQVVSVSARWAPTEPVYDEDGNYHRHSPNYGPVSTWNPLASAVEPIIEQPTITNNGNVYLNFNIAKGLSLKITGGGIMEKNNRRTYYNRNTLVGLQDNGTATLSESTWQRLQNSNILTYDNTWSDKHHLTVTGVVEQVYEESRSTSTTGADFLVDNLGFDNMSGAGRTTNNSFHSERSLLSYLGRVNYILASKYLFTFSYRADGSSVFGEDNKWGYFPSGSFAWRLSEENFLKESSLITDLKLRASYGLTGNQGIGPYQSLARLYMAPGAWGPNHPYNGQSGTDTGVSLAGIANPNLKWETTTQANFGVDFSMFEGRLTSTVDVYRKVTDDLLMMRDLPNYYGIPAILDNVGSVENKGLEVLIGGDPIIGNFNWNTSLNFTINRNKVLDLGDNDYITFNTTQGGYGLGEFMVLTEGEPFGTMRGWEFLGIWGTDEEEEARSYGQLPGDQHYLDLDEDGDVDEDDRKIIGQGFPDFIWGWSNRLTYKNWDLSFLLMGMEGVDLFNQLRIRREVPYEGNSTALLDVWTPENQDTNIPGMIDGKYREDQNLENKIFVREENTRWIEDASFIRLKTVTLAYILDPQKMKSIGFQKIRLFASGTNLFTITDYTGYDPEVAAFAEHDAQIGVDFAAYPASKTYTIGVELTF